MRSSRRLAFTILVPALKALLALLSLQAAAVARPPNIVLFYIDDLGWMDLGVQGSTFYETPAIDRLADDGIRFTNAYSPCPVCSPSRAGLITGKYPARVQFTGHITAIGRHRYPENGRIIPPHDRMYLPLDEVSIASALKPAGYVSASIGKWHLGAKEYWPRAHGFDVNIAGHTHGSPAHYFYPYKAPEKKWNPDIPNLNGGKPGEYLTDRLTDEALAFIESSANGGRPFFLYLTHYAVHTPLQAPEDLIKKYEAKMTTDSSQKSATYAAMVETVDRSVRRVIEALDRYGLTDNTVIIFTSDNGGESQATFNRPLREGKGYLYEGGIRVPLIIKWPGHIRPGSVSHIPVIGTDLYPTIAALAGDKAAPGEVVDGLDLAPIWKRRLTQPSPEAWPRQDLFWYYPHYSSQAQQPGVAVRSGNYKLIEHYDPPAIELYDLDNDIGETVNLSPKMPEKVTELREKIRHWLHSVDAKLHTPNPNASPSR